MSAENKICPHCGSDMFMATITRGGVIKVLAAVDENTNDEIQIIKEIQEKADIAVVKCARCRNQITQQDLIVGIKCKTCGNDTNPEDIDAEGNCVVCAAVANRQEIASASKEDLIRMLIEAEKKANPVVARIENKQELAEQTDKVNEATEEPMEDTAEAPAEKPVVKKTRKRKNAKVAAEEEAKAPEETTTTEEPMTEAIQEEVDNIANQQEAPFPDVTPEQEASVESDKLEDVLPGFANPAQQSEEKFEMFDDTDDVI